VFVSACIIYCLDLNDLFNIISLICSVLCAWAYTIFVVRVFFVIKGHIVNKLYNLIMLPSLNKVIIIIIIIVVIIIIKSKQRIRFKALWPCSSMIVSHFYVALCDSRLLHCKIRCDVVLDQSWRDYRVSMCSCILA